MYEEKTVEEWIQSICDPKLREQAIRNMRNSTKNSQSLVDNLARAIDAAFVWRRTPEGGEYWRDIQAEAKRHPEKFQSNFYSQKQQLKV